MRFYVEFLGFDDDVRIKEIYPTSNSFDIGISDLYKMEPRYDNITFQCDFDQNIFKYYPSTNNTKYKILSDIRSFSEKIHGEPGIPLGSVLWVDAERITVDSETPVRTTRSVYTVTRGVNNSIQVMHVCGGDGDGMTNLFATTQRLTPMGIICRFFSTNNIGGEETTLAYGVIKGVTLSNSKLITVECEHLYKQMSSNYKLPSILGAYGSYFSRDGYIFASNIFKLTESYAMNVGSVTGEYERHDPYSCEFISLFDMPQWAMYNCEIPCEVLGTGTSTRGVTVNMEEYFKFILNINNCIIVIDHQTNRYTLKQLKITTAFDSPPTEVFISNYMNLKNANINASTFEKVANIKLKYKQLPPEVRDWVPMSEVSLTECQQGYVDSIISSVSSKSVEINSGDILFNISSTTLMFDENFIYNRLSPQHWGDLVLYPSYVHPTRAYPRVPTFIFMHYVNEVYALDYDEVFSIDAIGSALLSRIQYLNLCTDVLEMTSTQWVRHFNIGERYLFSDNHLVKTMSDTGVTPIWTCIGYEGNTVRFLSSENWTRHFVTFYKNIKWNVEKDGWLMDVPRYVHDDSSVSTLDDGDVLSLYKYNKLTNTWYESDVTVSNVVWDNGILRYVFDIDSLVYDSDYIYNVTYKRGVIPESSKYKKFLYETYGDV